MGVASGYLGAAPSLLWASGAMFIAMAPLLVPVAIWIYTLVFAFASLWFAHYALSCLETLRAGPPLNKPDRPELRQSTPGREPSLPALPPAREAPDSP
jgi:hypothetical protein